MQQSPAPDDSRRPGRRFTPKWIIGGVAALVFLLVAGPWFYTQVLEGDQPDKLSLPAAPAAAASSAQAGGSLTGQWTVGPESVVGYRVKEILFGQDAEGVGRTSGVTGDLTVDGDSVTTAKFTADMTTLKSDKGQRDNTVRTRIMDTDTHPTATFVSTAPIVVPAAAAAGTKFTGKATGDLTLRGKTKSVTFDVSGQKSAAGFDVTAQIPIVFADYEIPNPSFGPAKVGDKGVLEVLLKLVPKS